MRRLSLVAGLVLLGLLPPAVAAFDPDSGDFSKDLPTDVRVLTYNTHREFIAEPSTDEEYGRIFSALDPDIIVFEEIYYTVTPAAIEDRLESILGGTWSAWTGKYSSYWVGGDEVLDVCNAVASRWSLSLQRWDTSPASSLRGVTMALVDLPDETYPRDFYVMGVHLKSNTEGEGEEERQTSADAIACWLGDLRDAPGAKYDYISLTPRTPVAILGDFNFLSETQPAVTVRTGEIQDTSRYGSPVKGDWDGSDLTDAAPENPFNGDSDTWPSTSPYQRFDRLYYTDSVLMVADSFILNTRTMSSDQRTAAGLDYDDTRSASDHLPMAVDFRVAVRVTPTPPGAAPTPSPVNLLQNSGFESWSGGLPEHWSLENGSLAWVTQTQTQVYSGSSSVALTTGGDPGSYGKGIYQTVYAVSAGDRFSFSAQVRSIENYGMGISGSWWDGSSVTYWSTVKQAVAGEWGRVELLSAAAPAGVQNLRVMVRGFKTSAFCGYADDALLFLLAAPSPTPAPSPSPAPNLLENGGFELWQDVSTLLAWERESYAATSQEYLEVVQGSYSARLSTTANPEEYGKGVYQDAVVTPGSAYTFSAWVRATAPNSAGIALSWWDGAISEFQPVVYNSGAAGWEKLSWSGQAPPGTVSARLYVRGFLGNAECGLADSARFWLYEITPVPTPVLPTPVPTPIPVKTPTPGPAVVGDYDGDGTSDIALFRPSSGLWLVRNLTKAWFGAGTDEPVPRDYSGNRAWDFAIYRPTLGKWMVRGVTSVFYGVATDLPVPADYNGDGSADIALFRPAIGKWLIRDVAQVYYGFASDTTVPGDYDGDSTADIAVFRSSLGKWLVKDGPQVFYGLGTDTVVPGDYTGDGTQDFAIFRPSTGRWLVKDGPSAYWGTSADVVQGADYDGDGTLDFAVFRPSVGRWLIRGVTSAYYGASSDLPVTNP